MTLWSWLGNNSSQIQALAGVFAVLVAIAVGWVAWKQKGAAEAQAAAAVKQTLAAEVQAEAARQQVATAKQQTATSLIIADKQFLPHFSVTQGIGVENLVVLNNGNGPALHVDLKYNDGLPGRDILNPTRDFIVGDSLTVHVQDSQRAANAGLRLTYRTIFGSNCTLEFQWNGLIQHSVNEKLTIEFASPPEL